MRILAIFFVFAVTFSLSFKNLNTHCVDDASSCHQELVSLCADHKADSSGSSHSQHKDHCSDHCAHQSAAILTQPQFAVFNLANLAVVSVRIHFAEAALDGPYGPFRPPLA